MDSICLIMLICLLLTAFVFIAMVVYEKGCILSEIKKDLKRRASGAIASD